MAPTQSMKLKVVTAPPSGAAPATAAPEEVVWLDNDGRVAAYGSTTGTRHLMRMPGLATFAWRDGSDQVTATTAAGRSAVVDAFRRCVLPMALHTRGLQVLHASAVLGPAGVVALCARSGTGKSTLAFGLSGRPGRSLWADDAVAFDASGSSVRALPLPFELHLRPASAAYFGADPVLAAGAAPGGSEPLAAVVVLERDESTSVQARRLTDAEAFTAVLQHAYCFDLEARPRRRETAERYLELSARVPVWELRFRAGLDELPAVIEALEEIG
jgi:hypothetical protein